MSSVPIEIERNEMGITHSDFERIFPRLVGDAEELDLGLVTTVNWVDGRRLIIHMSKEQQRKIAILRIPFVDIRFVFEDFLAEEAKRFMVRFDLAFHKGGG